MTKKYKILLTILLILLAFIIHQSLVLKLDARFNFWPVILIFILFIFGQRLALLWGIMLGFLLDHFSVLPFGTNLMLLFLIILILYLLIKKLITNRSFLSMLILTLIATLLYNGLLYLISELAMKWASLERIVVINLNTIFIQLISNTILVFLLFIITLYFTRKLNTNLIIKE